MKSFKIIVKTYNKKAGGTFTKAFCKGEYLPLVKANVEDNYTIKLIGVPTPAKDGIYSVSCEDNGVWLDEREGFAEKNIVRVKVVRIVFEKTLKTFPKAD